MHYKNSLIILLILMFTLNVASAEWFNSTGTDHNGADWTPADSSDISGRHYNIGTFTITSGYTVNIDTGTELEVFAETIHVYGTLDGDGHGATGSGDGAGGGSDSSGAGGGGGAGYGGNGAVGKAGAFGAAGAAGSLFGDNTTKIISLGSTGGNGGTNSGGYGVGGLGGASVLLYGDDVIVSGIITCDGVAGSAPSQGGGGGGGSGGGILIVGVNVIVNGTLSTDGGDGGDSGSDGDGAGGGGAGGRIKLVNPNLLDNWNFEFWSAGDSSEPDGWSNNSLSVINKESTIVKIGDYSAKLTPTNTWNYMYVDLPNPTTYQGKNITLNAWVYSTAAGKTDISIVDNVGYDSSTKHTGSSSWELLTVTRTIDAAATSIRIKIYPDSSTGNTVAYIDGVALVMGDSVPWDYVGINTVGISTSILKGSGGSGTTGVADDGVNGTYDIFNTSPPRTPTVITPTNNSDQGSSPVTLNVTAIDADGDSIQYYYYGDIVDGTTFLQNSSSYYDWSVGSNDYFWKARAYDGFMYSDYILLQTFTSFIPPLLYTPSNTSTQYTTFPPLLESVSFTWQDLGVSQYRLMVGEDTNFNILSVDTHIGTNNSLQTLLVNKEYFWKVYAYDGSTYSNASDVYQFNLTGNSTLTGSAIEGVVYQANGDVSAISGAEVTIWNSTWSDSRITGSNGYYVFDDLNSGTVYNLQAKSDRYWDSSIALVTAESDPVTNNFYLIDDLTDTEWWHYVEFTLQNVWGVTYPDVDTNVYIGTSPTIFDSGATGSDGTITFHLNQNIEYRITFINYTLGINEETIIYPVATSYTVYIDSYSFDLPDTVTDDIQAYITSPRINATYGYINFTWSDTSGLTTAINYYIHDVDGNELYNTSNSGPDMFNSQIVEATDDRYIVRYVGVHPTHGIIDKTETVVFHGGRRVDFGWPHDWQYAVTALAFLIFMGALFGAKTAHYGAITVVIFAWIFKWIGWLNETNTSTLLIILAAVIAFGWSLRKSEEVKM